MTQVLYDMSFFNILQISIIGKVILCKEIMHFVQSVINMNHCYTIMASYLSFVDYLPITVPSCFIPFANTHMNSPDCTSCSGDLFVSTLYMNN